MDGLLDMSIMKIPQIGFEQLDSRIVRPYQKNSIQMDSPLFKLWKILRKKTKRRREKTERSSGRLCERIKRSILERACIWPCGWRTKICTGCKCRRES